MFSGRRFLKKYFHELYVVKDLSCLERYLDRDYYDYDIGDSETNHIQNSKEYVSNIYKTDPSFRVEVKQVKRVNGVLCAHLRWLHVVEGKESVKSEGIAAFQMRNNRILKRNTLYFYVPNER